MKSKPVGVRFDTDLMKDLKENEKIETAQGVLNFLTDYYKGKKKGIIPPTMRDIREELLPKMVEAEIEVKKVTEQAIIQKPKIIRSFLNYQQLILDCETKEEYEKIVTEIEAATHLTFKQKNLLLKR